MTEMALIYIHVDIFNKINFLSFLEDTQYFCAHQNIQQNVMIKLNESRFMFKEILLNISIFDMFGRVVKDMTHEQCHHGAMKLKS